jgi:hypothetical protein
MFPVKDRVRLKIICVKSEYGDRVYGLQSHIEVTPAIVRDWLVHEQGIDHASISADSEKLFVSYRQRAMKFYRLFFKK